jgi:hypothetical protein
LPRARAVEPVHRGQLDLPHRVSCDTPTLTIVAMALRLGDHLQRQLTEAAILGGQALQLIP